MKVLVVDDDQRIRDALEIGVQLQWQDAKVLTAANGETGLELFFNEEPDIVLLDVTMPRKNGFEVLKAIRLVSDVPVIMLSADATQRQIERFLAAGAVAYLTKPIRVSLLLAELDRHLAPAKARV